MKCCDKELNLQRDKEIYYYYCKTCKIGGKGKDQTAAKTDFLNKKNIDSSIMDLTIPKNKADLLRWSDENLNNLQKFSATFMEKPATKRMIEKNVRYISRLDIPKVWADDAGRESIIVALEEAFNFGATLPDMGSIVPYGNTVEFIPAVEAFNFALTTGKNSPFKWTAIEGIYENDIYELSRTNGEFKLEFKTISPDRGDIIAVAVYGQDRKRDIIIGEIYSKGRLMGKAKQHSISYKYFLNDQALFDHARTEGTILKETGKEYIIKLIPKRNGGGTWEKKIFIDDLKNPYDGPDQPEMLRKSAGKTFFRPWMAIRNAVEMAGEWEENELKDADIISNVLDKTKQQFTNVQEGEIIPENDDDERI